MEEIKNLLEIPVLLEINTELKTWIVKILLPSLVAISIKLAVQSKKEAISWFSVVSSFITGIGSAYLCSDFVLSTVSHQYVPIAIAIITISGEKIGFTIVYKLKVEELIFSYWNMLRGKK